MLICDYSPLSLAFIGDSVYETFIRTKIIENNNAPAGKLHRQAVSFVNAKAQSSAVAALLSILTEDELYIYKRGRNAKSQNVPNNTELSDYKRATGLEALLGYLYLTEKRERLLEIMNFLYRYLKDEPKKNQEGIYRG